ncbi:MAG TPA: NAD(P)-dependent alcohol dehydrogenase [Pyrinomonadaceae bacterium]|nr:NAD(P)-dependent alcohol dehydrogenase [Pyrinomonadaceae bacterium]
MPMKAIVYHNDGSRDTLRCEEIEKPTPGVGEVLIKVRAASVNPLDAHLLKHRLIRRIMFAMSKQKNIRPGRDVAGEVEAVGASVTQFKPGDAVFGGCGGAFAEYACARESALGLKPDNMTFEQAAAVPVAGLTALQGLRDKGKIRAGQKVLINGASGGVGTFAVQIAKSFGAEVTGICSTRNVGLVQSLGADQVIDYTREEFIKGGQRYDLIFDLVANHSPSAHRRILNPEGIYIGVGMLGLREVRIGLVALRIAELVLSRFVSQRFVTFTARLNRDDLAVIRELVEAGKVRPVIDRRYSLNEVSEAVRYLEEGHARGKVIITL